MKRFTMTKKLASVNAQRFTVNNQSVWRLATRPDSGCVKRLVVFQHAATASSSSWLPFLQYFPALSASDAAIVAAREELRGSPWSCLRSLEEEKEAEELSNITHHVRGSLPQAGELPLRRCGCFCCLTLLISVTAVDRFSGSQNHRHCWTLFFPQPPGR